MEEFDSRTSIVVAGIVGIIIGAAIASLGQLALTGAFAGVPGEQNTAVLVNDFCKNRGYDTGIFESGQIMGQNVLKITCTAEGPLHTSEMRYAIINDIIYEWHQLY